MSSLVVALSPHYAARMFLTFRSPSRYVQGPDATSQLGRQLQLMGLTGPALILASAGSRARSGSLWAESLAAAGIPLVVHEFGGESSQDEIDSGVAAARASGAEVIVGAGGGKTLDTARAIAGTLGLAVVSCPTLASNDAPCAAVSVIYTPDSVYERLIFYPRNPDLVLVDTTIIANAPRRYLVSGMGDALATWFEARTVAEARTPNQVGGLTTITAKALARLCYDTLIADGLEAANAVDARAVTPALERIVEANTLLSGLGFESGGLAIAHSVHNGLTTAGQTHAYLHGEKVAFGLVVQLVVEGQSSDEIDTVIRFCRSVGLPTTLGGLGLADADDDTIRVIAERTVAEGETAHNEPFVVSARMIADGIRAADARSRTMA